MKTIEINNVLKAELLIVELPEMASMFPVEIINGNTYISYSPAPFAPPTNLELLANGNWKLLGKPDEISEEDARELVREMRFSFSDRYLDYTPYIYSPNHFKTAKESLMSAIETQVYWDVNPIPTPEIQGGYTPDGCFVGGWDDNWISEFEKAESRTFDRNRTLIFKKN